MATTVSPTGTTTAGVYVRISQDGQGLRAGVKRQRDDCLAYCEQQGWKAAPIYEDNDVSAYSGKPRRAYRRMLDDLKAGTIGAVVVWHPDRLHRPDLRELEDFMDLVQATGSTVRTVTAGDYDFASPEGRFAARINGSVARKESEDKSRRLKRKMQELAEQGKPKGGGRAFGYEVDGVTLVPEEAALIRQAAEDVLAGQSVRSIALRWNDQGVLTPRGNGWVPQVVRTMLMSPRIAGLRQHQGAVVGKAGWPAIIDQGTHERLRAFLSNPERSSHHGVTARRHFLAGFLYCGLCGNRLFAGVTNKKPAFHCKKGQTATGCGKLVVKAEPLCDLVREAVVARLTLSPTVRAELAKGEDDEPDYAMELEVLRLQLEDLQDNRFVQNTISHAGYLKVKSKLDARVDAITRKMSTRQSHAVLKGLPATPEAIQAAWDERGLEWQRSLLDALVERIDIAPAAYKGARFHRDRVNIRWRNG
ncbi:MAG TPA: recombinase family protein [Chloroflexota bacterium]|nr:recombinase family protein [Chloroflexota bacterium]